MPIRPENRARYPKDWPALSRAARERAGNACEGSPAFPDCRVPNGAPHPVTGSRVVLTVAHLDHTPENCEPANLRAWCQRCHNTYDAPMRRAGIASRARATAAVGDLLADDASAPPAPPPARELSVTGLALAIWICDRLSGECAPLVPGLFERALAVQLGETPRDDLNVGCSLQRAESYR